MLDLSAAFYTVNHSFLFGLFTYSLCHRREGSVMAKEYLTGCIQKVVIQDEDEGQLITSQQTFFHQWYPREVYLAQYSSLYIHHL